MGETSETLSLVWLKRLVTVLTGVMIVGMVMIVWALMVKLRGEAPLPEGLPEGVLSVSYTPRHVITVTDDELRVIDRATGVVVQVMGLE